MKFPHRPPRGFLTCLKCRSILLAPSGDLSHHKDGSHTYVPDEPVTLPKQVARLAAAEGEQHGVDES